MGAFYMDVEIKGSTSVRCGESSLRCRCPYVQQGLLRHKAERQSPLQHSTARQLWLQNPVASRCRRISVRALEASPEQREVPAELQKIITNFSMVPDAKIKYQQLLFLAKKLSPMPAAEHTDENKVKGCVSQVWVVPELKDGKVFWRADSDSALTKGLAALLVQGLSNCTPEEIVRIQPQFLERLGLGQALTPSRNNGFLNMFKLMQAKSLQLLTM